jgi:hypothetical protein
MLIVDYAKKSAFACLEKNLLLPALTESTCFVFVPRVSSWDVLNPVPIFGLFFRTVPFLIVKIHLA